MKILVSEREQNAGNIRIPKNALILIHDDGTKILCKKFPRNYKGKNPGLEIYYWDDIHNVWEWDLWQNKYTRILWGYYVKSGSKKLPQLLRPQVESVYNKVPHNTKIGHVQSPCMCDPERKRLADHRTTDYMCVKPSIYRYYSNLGCYGKSGDSMVL